MTKQEAMDYRRHCPYDAMGDFSFLEKQGKGQENADKEDEHPPDK